MTTAATKETTLLVLAAVLTAIAISIPFLARSTPTIDTVGVLFRAGAVVSWIVLAIVIGTRKILQQVRVSAGQIRADVKAAREVALAEIRRIERELGDQVAAKEFERRLTLAEEGDEASIAYLHKRGLPR